MNGAFARGHLSCAARFQVGAEQVTGPFDSGLEIESSSTFCPPNTGGNQIEIINCETGGRATLAGCQPDLGMRAALRSTNEGNRFPVRRPSGQTSGLRRLRDFDERSAGHINDPNVFITPFVELLSGAIGNKSDLLTVR